MSVEMHDTPALLNGTASLAMCLTCGVGIYVPDTIGWSHRDKLDGCSRCGGAVWRRTHRVGPFVQARIDPDLGPVTPDTPWGSLCRSRYGVEAIFIGASSDKLAWFGEPTGADYDIEAHVFDGWRVVRSGPAEPAQVDGCSCDEQPCDCPGGPR